MGYWDNLNMNWKLHDILFSFLAVIMICGEEVEFPYSQESHSEEFRVVSHDACNLQSSSSMKKKNMYVYKYLIDRNIQQIHQQVNCGI